jgi:hypothetical protein
MEDTFKNIYSSLFPFCIYFCGIIFKVIPPIGTILFGLLFVFLETSYF